MPKDDRDGQPIGNPERLSPVGSIAHRTVPASYYRPDLASIEKKSGSFLFVWTRLKQREMEIPTGWTLFFDYKKLYDQFQTLWHTAGER